MADVTMKPCGDCGMPCTPAEYHPYAACLMFKACHNSATVRANLPDYEALRKRCEAVEAALAELREQVMGMKENPNRGDMVFRCGFNGAIDCVVGRIDQAIAAAQEPSHG